MTLSELVPWGRKDRGLALRDRESDWAAGGELSPFLRLHHEMNRLFDVEQPVHLVVQAQEGAEFAARRPVGLAIPESKASILAAPRN